ncbi:hypothetical protein KIN20_018804 [Parelaphostrongylus tenuis]|uniref:SHSP domain-containing protein n=1 Tax=Parelaphostrongylus tenuis TaxID=148309 RepID=A0AAD5QPV5_PARTN|nr:hypothetical protein KIN20_018804 [Parelaphostrongylus tenuis]
MADIRVSIHHEGDSIKSAKALDQINQSKAFTRQFELPEDVNLDAIRSSLTDGGQLSVEAPKLIKSLESGGRSIPIEKIGEKGIEKSLLAMQRSSFLLFVRNFAVCNVYLKKCIVGIHDIVMS